MLLVGSGACVVKANSSRIPNLTAPFRCGYQELTDYFDDSKFTGRVWYPISQKHPVKPVPAAPIFKPFLGAHKAPLFQREQRFPLLLLSHGSGGLVQRLDWLAHPMVERGWIVAAMNHPGNTYGDNSAEGFMQVWQRPQQLSRLLDRLLAKGPFAAIGHSAGGAAVLLLAGARLDHNRLQNPVPFCVAKAAEFDDERCGDLQRIDPKKYNKREAEANYHDERIKAVVAMDPGFARSFFPGKEQPLVTPTLLLLADKLKSSEGVIYAKELPSLFPKAESYVVPGTIHISFLTSCSKQGFKLKPPICVGDTRRDQLQQAIHERILAFVNQR